VEVVLDRPARSRWPGVEQRNAASWRENDGGIALPHVERREAEGSCRETGRSSARDLFRSRRSFLVLMVPLSERAVLECRRQRHFERADHGGDHAARDAASGDGRVPSASTAARPRPDCHTGDAGDGVSALCAARDEPRLAIPALDLRAIESSPLLMSSLVRTIGVDVPPSTPPSEVLELQDAL